MAKTGRRKAKQQTLPEIGPVDGQIKELETLGDELDEIRTQRISLQADEADCQGRLVQAMRKHNVKTYKYEGKTLVHEHKEEEKVKVKKDKVDAEE